MLKYLNVELRLLADNFNNSLKVSQKELKEFEKTVKPTTDLLKGMGVAATSLGKALTVGLTAPIVGMGVFAVKQFNESAEAAALMENAIRSTGGAAKKTAAELTAMATALESNSVFGDDEIIKSVTTQLLTFTNISGKAFDGAAKAALNMSTVLGQDLQTSAIQVGKALNDPVAGVTALQRVGVKLTESQKALVASFVRVGDVAGAQTVILKELETEFGGAAEAAAKVGSGPMKQLRNQIGNLSESWGKLIEDALNPFILQASDVVKSMDSMSEATKRNIAIVAALTAALGPALLGIGQLAFGINNLILLGSKLTVPIGILGGASVAAAAGVAALGAAIGIAAGMVTNYLIKITGLTKATDVMIASYVKWIPILGDWVTGQDLVTAQTNDTARALGQLGTHFNMVTAAVKENRPAVVLSAEDFKRISEEIKKTKEGLRELAEFWKKAMLEFRNETFAGGAEVKAGLEAADVAVKKIIEDYKDLLKVEQEAGDEQIKNQEYWNKQLEIFRVSTDSVKDAVKAGEDAADRSAKKVIENMEKQKKALESAVQDVKRSAGAVFDAMLIKGQSVFTSLKNLLKGGALSLGRAIFEDIAGALLGPIKKAFDDFFEGLLKGSGIKALISGLGEKLGGVLKGGLGGGSGFDPGFKSVTGGFPSGGGSSGGGGGSGLGSLLGSGGVIGAAINALGSIGVILQLKRLEGTMNAVEHNTRYVMIDFENSMDIYFSQLSHILPMRIEQHTQTTQLDAIYNVLRGGGATGKASGVSTSNSTNFYVNVNVDRNADLTATGQKHELIAAIKSWLDMNSDGFRENVTLNVVRTAQGLVTSLG